jgi:hypothetical protein
MKYRNVGIIIIIFLLVITSLLSLSCSSPAVNEVNPGQEFALSFGQSARIAGENISIKFADVISDSRCPQGVTCIWAGEASCMIEITGSDAKFSKVLVQSGSGNNQADFQQYRITFDLLPHPQAGKSTAKKDYYLRLTISKK